MAWRRILTVAIIQGRGLVRRRLAMLLLVVVPGAFFLAVSAASTAVTEREKFFNLNVGVMGVAWAVGGGAFFLGLSARQLDERLVLAGYRAGELALGRLAFLLVGAIPIVLLYGLMLPLVAGTDVGLLFLAVCLTALVSVALGLAFASILPRELEGVLLLIAVIGVQSSTVNAGSGTTPALPFFGPLRIVKTAWDSSGGLIAPTAHSLVTFAALLGLATWMWRSRLKVAHATPRSPRRQHRHSARSGTHGPPGGP